MYMTSPTQRRGWEDINRDENSLTRTQTSFEGKSSSEEYNRLWKELRHSGGDLDRLYGDCRSGTFKFKDNYDVIKKAERLNEALRQLYYDALSRKKKHDEDRDNYFKNEEDLVKLKEEFIEESQLLALSNSKYIDYNQRFTVKREKLICQIISDVNKVNEQNNKLKSDKDKLTKELGECRTALYDLREYVKETKQENNSLGEKLRKLEEKRDRLIKESDWLLRQNNKLKESNSRRESEISSMNEELKKLQKERNEQNERQKDLQTTNDNLNNRCQQLQQLLDGAKEELSSCQRRMEESDKEREKEKEEMKEEMKECKRKMDKARMSNYNTMLKNEQLREKLKSANHKAELVIKDKLKSISIEHKTRDTNVELASHQLHLINEVLELKSDFFRDQERIRKGAKLNRKLEQNVSTLRQKIQLIRENPSAIDPLDGAQEYREITRQKYCASRRFLQTSSSVRPAT